MTTQEARREAARLWVEKSADALTAARHLVAVSPSNAVSTAYYASFYAASAVLMLDGRKFVKHNGVRDALHKHIVHSGRLSTELGSAYNDLMTYRHQADYEATASWTAEKAQKAIESAERIVAALKGLLPPGIVSE